MTSFTANLFRATRRMITAVVTSLILHAGPAHADTYTFTSDGLFSTDVIGFAFGESNSGNRIDSLALTLPINATTPELFKLVTDGGRFDATLTASTPTEILTYDMTQALIANFYHSSELPFASALVKFTTLTSTVRPVQMAAPEIDPASIVGSLFLLTGGLAVLRGRRTGALVGTC
jgi:hypothetical protein